jgi:mono/diheme cytochrome c family protein
MSLHLNLWLVGRVGLAAVGVAAAFAQSANPSIPATFDKDVAPIFKANCASCHGESVKIKELNLNSEEAALKGSDSGPVIVPGKPDESLLYKKVREGSMPMGKAHLSDQQIETIFSWIKGGVSDAAKTEKVENSPVTQHDVVPILLTRCIVCHGLRKQEGGLDLRSKASMLKGGVSGPAIVLGKPEDSLLIKRVNAGEMPPKQKLIVVGVKPMAPAETEKIARWIRQGAPEVASLPDLAGTAQDPLVAEKDRQFWAFQTPRRPEPPLVKHGGRVRNPIDAFVLSKLEGKGLSLSPEADRLTLIRRAYFDLTGLPPEQREIQAFVADKDPQAFDKLIDRLLASPRYGERWGRYWLDVAGYADSEGGKLSADLPRPFAFRYRDYVIRAFNEDKPYNRFLMEQIAGDELADYEHASVVTQELMDNLIATGFLRMAPDSTTEREVNFVDDRVDVIADEIETVSSSVMGLTIKCARCHNHKYDPLPQRDYYRFKAIFKGAYDEHDWVSPLTMEKYDLYFPGRYLPYATPGATPVQLLEEQRNRELLNKNLEAEIKTIRTAWEDKIKDAKKKLIEKRIAAQPKDLQEDLRKLVATPAENRNEVQKYLAQKFESVLHVNNAELKADPAYVAESQEVQKKVKLLQYQVIPEPKIRALWDRGTPSPTYILRRGMPTSFGQEVQPGPPAVLTSGTLKYEVAPPWPGSEKTGRRLAFAKWLTNPEHPLTSRVMVNRIWKHHFGNGIVRSVGNFGKTGTPPSNPELLDWLATEFVKQGWSIKQMHRLMMTSSVYRQASVVSNEAERVDPDNVLLSHMPLRRMEAEVLNDTLLLVSGRLDETRYGVAEPVLLRDDGLVTPIETGKGWRRSIYIEQRRKEIPTLLDNFDLPPMSPNCVERTESTVSLQALYLMNNGMVRRLADSLADRIVHDAGHDPQRQIESLYWLAVSRPPTVEEAKASLETLSKLEQIEIKDGQPGKITDIQAESRALAKLCHTVFNSAAFIYID